MNSTVYNTQPFPFSHISGFTFYPPKSLPKEPDKIDTLLYVNGPRSGYKHNLIQGELSRDFLAGISCTICKGILNLPTLLPNNAKACQNCTNYRVQIDQTLTNSILGFNIYCPNYKRGCSWSGAVNSVIQHLEKNCDFVYLKCGYVEMGLCLRAEVLMRHQLIEHHKKAHAAIERILDEVSTLKKEVDQKTQENRMLMLENQFLKQTYQDGTIIIRIQDFNECIGHTISSPIFQTRTPPNIEATFGYNLQITMIIGSDNIISALVTVKDGHSDEVLPWPMLVNYSVTIFSYLNDSLNVVCTLSCDQIPPECREKGSEQAYGWSPLTTYQELCNRILLKDKTVYFKVKDKQAKENLKFLRNENKERFKLTLAIEKEKQDKEEAAKSAYIGWLTKKYRQRKLEKQSKSN
ncbi:TNF receptor-associated factor 4 [Oopsacas minuta]|uniref:TNF receptor-associated factor 4 n=1 Tax=Oopsacas minuta TaxID=111878 RepID=A0AAV7K381_9METZ|nr:TNF receptor-associated factor 4 [Oopsacas minuta]